MSRFPSVWKLVLLYGFVTALLLGWNRLQQRGDGLLRVSFLDVGQADSCVIQTPSGKVIVVDTGGIGAEADDDAGRRVVAPFLKHAGLNHIDTLILTHPHADHIGGAVTLLHQFDTTLLLDNGQPDDSPFVTRYLEEAQFRHVLHRAARRGQSLDCGDGVVLDALGPTEAETRGSANNASVVVRLRYNRVVFLLTGDAEAEEEADLLADSQPLACDVLKAGHHGSVTSSTPAFLTQAHPRFAVISVGAHNLYGHPGPAVLNRLRDGQTRVVRTDQAGAVLCVSDGVAVRVQPMLAPNP